MAEVGEIFYKAITPDGTSFFDPNFRWVPEDWDGKTPITVRHPNPLSRGAAGYLSVSVAPTDCTGMSWPCQLLRVEPVIGEAWTPSPDTLPNKRASHSWRVVERLNPAMVLGPYGEDVVAIFDRAKNLTLEDMERMHPADVYNAWRMVQEIAVGASRANNMSAAWGAISRYVLDISDGPWALNGNLRFDAEDVVKCAAYGTLVRDSIDDVHYRAMIKPWLFMIGEDQPHEKKED